MNDKVAAEMATKMDTGVRVNAAYIGAVHSMAKKRKHSEVLVDSESELELSSSPPNSDEDE
jgi:hypothetical protein